MDEAREASAGDGGTDPPKRLVTPSHRTNATTPAELLVEITDALHAVAHDPAAVMEIGVGALESMFHQGYVDDEIWPEVERLARNDPVFRRALRSVWADFERVQPLLWELGEWRRAVVSFVTYDEECGPDSKLVYRALSASGIETSQLPALLRDIADEVERNPKHLEPPAPTIGEPPAPLR